MRHTFLTLAVLAAFFAAIGQANAGFVTVAYPGAADTSLIAIDGNNVLGNSTSGYFIYNTSTGSYTPLAIPSGNPVGISGNLVVGNSDAGAFIYNTWTQTNTIVPVPTGYWAMDFTGVSGSTVVGWTIDRSGTTELAISYDANNGQMATLNPAGNSYAGANAVSGNTVVGYYFSDGYTSHSFVSQGGPGAALPDPPGIARLDTNVQYANPTGVNGNDIVGNFSASTGPGIFLWNGTSYAILDPPGAAVGNATGVYGDYVIGDFSTDPNGAYGQGFLYEISSGTYTAIDYPGAAITEFVGIDDNLAIGNFNTATADGNEFGFVYTIPEPAALVLFAIGMACMVAFARWRCKLAAWPDD